jgi:sugar phosphate isomerase/epimerase
MGEWPIGISTGCFARTPIASCLETIRASGFHLLEICSFPRHLDYHDRGQVEAAAGRLRELELEAFSFHAPFAPQIDISALDPAARHQAVEEIGRAAEAAALLGAGNFVLHPGPESGGGPAAERLTRMENIAASLELVAGRCRDLGVGLVLENMLPHLFSGHVRDLLWLMGALRSKDVGLCLDTGHAYLSGDLEHVAHKLSGHLRMLHASDNRGTFDDHLPPGEGLVPWNDLFEQLKQSRFEGTVILEIAGGADPESVLAGARRARTFLRGLERRPAAAVASRP